MEQDCDLARLVDAHSAGCLRVEDLVHGLDLQEVVAGAQGTKLSGAPLSGPLSYCVGAGIR